jgi:type IV conjugative transfer system protein TraL
MNENLKIFIPKNLDAMPKVFLWDMDVAMIFMVVLGIGILMGAFFTPLGLALFLGHVYQKAKSGRQAGYSVHLLYWFSPVSIGNRRTPPSCSRNFVG